MHYSFILINLFFINLYQIQFEAENSTAKSIVHHVCGYFCPYCIKMKIQINHYNFLEGGTLYLELLNIFLYEKVNEYFLIWKSKQISNISKVYQQLLF